MRLMRLAGVLILVALALAGVAAYRLLTPYRGFQQDTFVDVPHGVGTGGIADRLAEAGVVRSRWDFLLARMVDPAGVLQAGEYRFRNSDSTLDVMRRIARGDVFYYTLLIPEGKNMFDIASAAAALGLFGEKDFLAAARDASSIADLDPHAPTLEGYLFPGSYRLARQTTPRLLCRKMTDRFREVWKGLHAESDAHSTVTLASMVEKEAKLPEERPRIAAVFENRLRLGMKLDCDPTTIYAALLQDRYRGAIYRSDLQSGNPYNTYQHNGLPPGPIANPGLASIQAALSPAYSHALYFVLRPDGSGGHQFSDTLAQHSVATNRYRHARPR